MVTPTDAQAHVFVDHLDPPLIDPGDRHHLSRVLRLPPGSEVTACDGRGAWRRCRLTGDGSLEPSGDVVVEPAPGRQLTVAFALVKGQRPELVVQKLTELGIDRIVPFAAERSVVRWDEAKAARQADRHREVARQAAMQCRRTHLPEVASLQSFAAVARLDGAVLADAGGGAPTDAIRTVLIGPEGGWSDAERGQGLSAVRLGEHVLRSETAAITAGVLLAALRGGIVSVVR